MAWGRMDDGFHDHPKVGPLSLAAVGLWTMCWSWANKQLRSGGTVPGLVPAWRAKKFGGTSKLIRELVDAGLWEPADDGWMIHDFVDYLPKGKAPATQAEVSAARSEAGRRGAQARWHPDGKHDDNLPSTPDGKTHGKQMPPYPTRTQEGGGPSTRPPATCPRHPHGTDQPCRACADARRAHDAWTPTAPTLPTATEALTLDLCPRHKTEGFRADACPLCRRAS